ncbi:hypothetical protein HMPREF0591_1033 [Mycobacterium parascrofulaceum ATCC BAA-614]|uniref:Transport acessory protein MmpS n=1 Tax=Mycobacterium parascrofulaceum ATCC BAA-614 TaxID=525368 RepID=D5P4D9_9MYCO|nr:MULTISPECIES: MmpS family transport accessory protein [Mycobacterium]EFG79136.1 hypothetical protein HMPREF0591_1033 [Mycobacterium parascrofulaceum ATCC BAA-614]OCB57960.1 hypothetical protein A9X02_07935 [Mycobacterium malmoense]
MVGLLKRAWVPLAVALVLGFAGLSVSHLRGMFGSHQKSSAGDVAAVIEPVIHKQVTYEIYGSPTTLASINYLDAGAAPRDVEVRSLPWSYTITTRLPAVFANVVAQGDGDRIGCRIIVNGEVRDQQSTNGKHALASCLVKAA